MWEPDVPARLGHGVKTGERRIEEKGEERRKGKERKENRKKLPIEVQPLARREEKKKKRRGKETAGKTRS